MFDIMISRFVYCSNELFRKLVTLLDYLTSNQKMLFMFLFTFSFLTRIPGILILEREVEPGIDGAYYHNVATNLFLGNGEVSNIKDRWFVDWKDSVGDITTPYSFGPLYVYLLSIVFHLDNSLLTIRIMNTFLSSLSIIFYYLFLNNIFSKKVSFISTMILIFMPLNYLYSVSLLTESLYLFLLFLTLYSYSMVDSKFKYALLGILSGFCFLCRFPGLFLILCIFFAMLSKRKVHSLLIYSLFLFFTVSPWLFTNYTNTGFLFPYFNVYSEVYPILWEGGQHHLRSMSFVQIYYRIYNFFTDIFSLNLLSLFVPLIIIGVYNNFYKERFKIILLLIFISIFYHVGHHYTIRYMLPVVCLLLPFGINELIKISKLPSVRESFLNSNLFVLFIVSLYVLPAILSTPVLLVNYFPYYDSNEIKYEWLNENSDHNDVLCSTQPRTTSFFTQLPVVRLDNSHSNNTLDMLISEYNITFIIFNEFEKNRYRHNHFLIDFYDNDIGDTVNSSQNEFELVYVFSDEKYILHIYSVKLKAQK